MKAFALVEGPRRKFIAVSESTIDLWIKGAYLLGAKDVDVTRGMRECTQLCRAAGMYIVRADFKLGDPITKPRKKK
jgi:hypothetical protein